MRNIVVYEGIPWEMSTIRDTESLVLVIQAQTSSAENEKTLGIYHTVWLTGSAVQKNS